MKWFSLAAYSSFLISALHIVIVCFLGADGYRTFGAGEKMARLAEEGSMYPHLLTLAIAIVFAVFGLYALAGQQTVKRPPFLFVGLILIAFIYLIRGLGGIPMYFSGHYNHNLIIWSSIISFSVGCFYTLGIIQHYNSLKIVYRG